jgi:hypothetical protein
MQHVGTPVERRGQVDGGCREPNEAARVAVVAVVDRSRRQLLEIQQIDDRGSGFALAAAARTPAPWRAELEHEATCRRRERLRVEIRRWQVLVLRQQHADVVTARGERVAQAGNSVREPARLRKRRELGADHQNVHRGRRLIDVFGYLRSSMGTNERFAAPL